MDKEIPWPFKPYYVQNDCPLRNGFSPKIGAKTRSQDKRNFTNVCTKIRRIGLRSETTPPDFVFRHLRWGLYKATRMSFPKKVEVKPKVNQDQLMESDKFAPLNQTLNYNHKYYDERNNDADHGGQHTL